MRVRGAKKGPDSAFNLSILECKLVSITDCLLLTPLLISPYWNVNQNKSGCEEPLCCF